MEKEEIEIKNKKRKMTIPNKLTIMRILFIPLMVIIYYIPWLRNNNIFLSVSYANFINAILFTVASLTDMADGKIARKYNLVTTFGKFADPLADKCLVFTAMYLIMVQPDARFIHVGQLVPVWAAVVIMIREFMVSGIRLVCVEDGTVIAASKFGKWKTATTMVALFVLFFFGIHKYVALLGYVLFMISTLLTALSGVDYFWKNRKAILKSI